MAFITENTATGDGSQTDFPFTFPYIAEADVKVTITDANGDPQLNTDFTFANATTLSFNTAPISGRKIRIFRDTNLDSAVVTYFAGSAIRAEDLNDNQNQVLYSAQEVENGVVLTTGGTMVEPLIFDDTSIKITEADDTLTLNVPALTDDHTISFPDVSGTVVTTGDNNTVTGTMIANDAINGDRIADDSINSEHYVDGSIDLAHLSADSVDGTKIADNAIDSEHYVDGSIDRVHLAADIVDGTKLADDSVNSEHIASGAIDLEHMSHNSVDSNQYVDGSIDRVHLSADIVDGTKLADNAVDSEHYTDGSIDRVHLAADIVDGTKIADNSIDSEHYVDSSIDAIHLATDAVTTGKINADAITNAKIADDAVQAENIKDLTATIAELNQLDGNTLSNSVSDWTSGTTFPSAAQISDRLSSFGGFQAIANESSFPNDVPSAGVVISIANADGLSVDSSGVGTGATLNSTSVTINGFPSGFNSTDLDDGIGLLVAKAGGSDAANQVYDFHRVVAKNEDVRQLSSDINDFKARYRTGTSNPTSDNDAGDLFFNTGSSKMLVRNGNNDAWEEVQSIGEFFIIPDSDFPTWNGTINDISITDNAPANAEQIILSINGVIQQPKSGTDRPSEGFSLNGSTIRLSAAPASGSVAWGVIVGSTVNIGTPSAGTVSEAKLNCSNDPTNNHVLTADSTVTGGLKWAAAPTTNLDAAVTINDSGNAVDFRVESQNEVNALLVNGTTNSVGIGVIPNNKLHVAGTAQVDGNVIVTGGNNLQLNPTNNPQNKFLRINADDLTTAYNLTMPPAPGTANQVLTVDSVSSTNLELSWADQSASGGATGGGDDQIFNENGTTVTTNYTVGTTLGATDACNAMSTGPITVNSGVTVTVDSGSRWVII